MKFLAQFCIIFVFLSVGLAATDLDSSLVVEEPKLGSIFDDIVKKIIINLVASLPKTIEVPHLPISLNETKLITGSVDIANLTLSGLKELVATKIKVNILTLALQATLEVPKISFFTNYDADVSVLGKIPVFGNGNISANIDKMLLNIGGKAKFTSGLSLSNVTVSFTLGNTTKFSVIGLLDDDKLSTLLTESLNDDLVSFLNDNETLISNVISPIAGELINAILNRKKQESLADFNFEELLDEIAKIQNE
ncbi:unnamed protein product [Ceutorhynchus assimilis]|uniref:Uncharacterized protein n=1 Tax=Ceutorhynchus assimilis TaxID=467358 RepID=A0A9N9MKC0_9CUCU|nr:unnamed protein product [Ceutorhynchus assimilis]